MNEEFRAFGSKNWVVKDDMFLYGKTQYQYSDFEFFKLVTTPTTGLTNGVAQGRVNGKIITCAFKYADKERAHNAINFVRNKIDEAHGIINDYKYIFTAHTGTTLEVYDSYLVLNHMQTGSLTKNIVRGGALGGKRIAFTDLTAVQFREPSGMTVGFIQFAYPGSIESKMGVIDMINDENSIPVPASKVDEAKEIVAYIEGRRRELKSPVAPEVKTETVSAADEIKKFKELLDMGAITEEEFDRAKKNILGM